MASTEKIHIMSAGAHVHETFPIAVNTISPADEVYIIVEKWVKEDSDDPKEQKERVDIRNSIAQLETIANPFLKKEVQIRPIPDNTLDKIRDEVFNIYEKNPKAQYYFNVSGGPKALSIGLFMMSLWIEGVPYHIDRKGIARTIAIPKVHIEDFQSNPNRVKILKILDEKERKELSRKELFIKLSKEYTAVRDRERVDRTLKDGVFNSLTSDLLKWGLITEDHTESSKKEKKYLLTPDGEFTLKFVSLRK